MLGGRLEVAAAAGAAAENVAAGTAVAMMREVAGNNLEDWPLQRVAARRREFMVVIVASVSWLVDCGSR